LALQIEWAWSLGHLPGFTDWVIGQGVPRPDKAKQYWICQSDGLIINDRFRTDRPFPLVFDVKNSSYREGTIIQARKPHLRENQRWTLQEPSIIFTPQEELLPPTVRKCLIPGLSVTFSFPKVIIQPHSNLELCLELNNREEYRESSNSAFLRLAEKSFNDNQLFWYDEDQGVFISCQSGLALRYEAEEQSGARIIPWASFDSIRKRWSRNRDFLFIGKENLYMTIATKAVAGSEVNLDTLRNQPSQKWVIEYREPRPGFPGSISGTLLSRVGSGCSDCFGS
jgi:hypothetical protein